MILAFILQCSLALPGSAAVPDGLLASDASLPLSEEKAYCNATLEDDFADDRVVVVLSNKASTSLRTYTTADFEGIGCTKVQNLTQHTTELVNAKLRGETAELQKNEEPDVITFAEFKEVDTKTFRQILCLTLDKASKQNVLDVIDILMKHPDVLSAEPDYAVYASSFDPLDPYNDDQWAISKIDLSNAWNYVTGSSAVRVGVIDSGIDGDHPELDGQINVSLSRTFIDGVPSVVYSVSDSMGHGTHVAGIIGAETNNNQGISGTCFHLQLVSLQVFDGVNNASITSIYQAVDYARSQSIPILNMSVNWLGSAESQSNNTIAHSVLADYPGLIVCSAGNYDITNYIAVDIDDTMVFPGSYALGNLVVVGASTETDSRWVGSHYGKLSVDLFAPGNNILSCYPLDECNSIFHKSDQSYQYHVTNGYHRMPGTSMAAPHVTGVAALILAKYPTLSAMQIKERILESVDPVSAFSGICVTGGRLNAYKAVHPHSFYDNNTTTHHSDACLCGVIRNKETHTYEQVGPSLYRCTVCGYENEWLP